MTNYDIEVDQPCRPDGCSGSTGSALGRTSSISCERAPSRATCGPRVDQAMRRRWPCAARRHDVTADEVPAGRPDVEPRPAAAAAARAGARPQRGRVLAQDVSAGAESGWTRPSAERDRSGPSGRGRRPAASSSPKPTASCSRTARTWPTRTPALRSANEELMIASEEVAGRHRGGRDPQRGAPGDERGTRDPQRGAPGDRRGGSTPRTTTWRRAPLTFRSRRGPRRPATSGSMPSARLWPRSSRVCATGCSWSTSTARTILSNEAYERIAASGAPGARGR